MDEIRMRLTKREYDALMTAVDKRLDTLRTVGPLAESALERIDLENVRSRIVGWY